MSDVPGRPAPSQVLRVADHLLDRCRDCLAVSGAKANDLTDRQVAELVIDDWIGAHDPYGDGHDPRRVYQLAIVAGREVQS